MADGDAKSPERHRETTCASDMAYGQWDYAPTVTNARTPFQLSTGSAARRDGLSGRGTTTPAMKLVSSPDWHSHGPVSRTTPQFLGMGISAGHQGQGEGQTGSNTAGNKAHGDVSAHGLWKKGKTCIMDIRITDTDAKSYSSSSSRKVLEKAARQKKDKYLGTCLEWRRSFVPLVYLVDGMVCKEARAFEKRVTSLLASKWD